ncbi:MAG: hypothetical protein C0432_02640 [Candidatus Puniceispirillum sp.]|nr:hypothetical protein [Candidatus Pelagibacter sp.]MBA4283173.1 hypothetical protein [Candidatus Puniceispirillum sp.]
MTLSYDEVKKIAHLSRLNLKEDQMNDATHKLNSIFEWIQQLQDLEINLEQLTAENMAPQMHEREDAVAQANDVKSILKNAPSVKHDMFVVAKVVE